MDVEHNSEDEDGIEDAECLYAVLGVPKDALAKDIKKAYYKLVSYRTTNRARSFRWFKTLASRCLLQAMKYHPDHNQGDAESTAKFQQILKAYNILFDPEKRCVYMAGCDETSV